MIHCKQSRIYYLEGTVARATLYFLLRYPEKISQYTREQLTMPITWHVNEPVTRVMTSPIKEN